jgi:Ca-activated chloride channel homolog
MAAGLVEADASGKGRGEEFIKALRPVGGTNINGALVAAMRQFDGAERPRMLVFLTDGLPTVGETKIERIVENARAARVPGVRLFTFGVGYDVNTALLDKLAAENGGVAEYVEPKEDLEVKVSSFFTKINHPVLTDLAMKVGGVETDLLYPRELPDIFRGTQVTVIGRYRNSSDARDVTLNLTGRTGGRERAFSYTRLAFPVIEKENDFLPRLWATRRVGWLMEQIRSNGEQKELRDEVVELGTRYGIVTPYTSYLALEPGADFSANRVRDLPFKNRSAQGRADARSSADAGRGMVSGAAEAPPPPAAAKARTGEAAVRESKRQRAQQDVVRLDDADAGESVRKVGGKTFYLREGVWVDAEFREDSRLPETKLAFGGEEYFALVGREPELARYLALGERVVVVFKGRVYRVSGEQ